MDGISEDNNLTEKVLAPVEQESDVELETKVKKYLRGEGANLETLKDKKLKTQLASRDKKSEERKCLEKKIEAKEMEIQKLDKETVELECMILELQRQEEAAKEKKEAVKGKKEAAEKRIFEMKSCAEKIDQEIEDLKVEFQKTASAPW